MTTTAPSLAGLGHDQVRLGLKDSRTFPFDDVRYTGSDVHDPSLIKFDGTYVMVATSGTGFVPMWTSSDLVSWKFQGPILPATPDWLARAVPQHQSVWAPAPIRVGKSLRIYYSASQKFGSNTSFIGFAENPAFDPSRPLEGWVDRGMLVESLAGRDPFNAIDPDVCAGPDGRQWMVFGSYWRGIYLTELNPVTGGLRSEGQNWIHVAANPHAPGNPLEAPILRYHEGYYYLYVTYGLAAQGVRSTYHTVVGRSKTPEGPYLGYDGREMTDGGNADLLGSSPPMFGPGGGNVFTDSDGQDYIAYHYYDGTRHWHGEVWGKPTLQVRKLIWGEDGWPLPGMPAGIHLKSVGPLTGSWDLQTAFGSVETLTLGPEGKASMGDMLGTWTLRGKSLVIKWPGTATGQPESTGTLTVDDSHQFFVGRNQAGAIVRGIKADARYDKL